MLSRLATFGLAAAALGPAAPTADSSVMIMDYRYDPASLTVDVGDSVTWTNHDQAEHDVAGTSGPAALQSPALGQGQSWSHTFAAAGTYDYICSFHPDMTASITVEPVVAPTAPPTAAPPAPGVGSPAPASEVPTEGAAEPGDAETAATQPPAPTASAPTTTAATATASSVPAAAAEELAARPVASESHTSLPPLGVGAAVTAVVLACTLLLLGAGRPDPNPSPASPPSLDPTSGASDDPTLRLDD